MYTINRVSSNQCFDQIGFDRFRRHIDRERAGSQKDLRTKFYGEDTPRKDILESWGNIIENSNVVSKPLMEFEHDMLSKVGPYSIFFPLSERMKGLESYYEQIKSEPINQSAIELSVQWLSKISGLRTRDQRNVIKDMRLDTSSGAPFMIKRNLCVERTIPVRLIDGKIHLPDGEYTPCAVLGHRSQEGGPEVDNVKNRIIWMFMFGYNILEHTVYKPLIEAIQSSKLIPAYVSNDEVDIEVTKLFDSKGQKDNIVSTDFKEFDQHFSNDMQNAAKSIIFNIFQFQDILEWIEKVYPLKYNIPMAFNYDGDQVLLMCGKHGMASGSGGTNMDESLAHKALQFESALENDSVLNPHSMCLGDDGILSYPGITIDKIVRSYSKHGLIMNTTKQHISSTDAIYLRRFYDTNYRIKGVCRGVYSTYRAVGRLMATERSIPWTKELTALRQLSILENCKWHPLREQFVDWCMKGDRYRLGIDIPGFMSNIEEHAHKAIAYMPDFLGYTRSLSGNPVRGIKTWWVYNYLKSKL